MERDDIGRKIGNFEETLGSPNIEEETPPVSLYDILGQPSDSELLHLNSSYRFTAGDNPKTKALGKRMRQIARANASQLLYLLQHSIDFPKDFVRGNLSKKGKGLELGKLTDEQRQSVENVTRMREPGLEFPQTLSIPTILTIYDTAYSFAEQPNVWDIVKLNEGSRGPGHMKPWKRKKSLEE